MTNHNRSSDYTVLPHGLNTNHLSTVQSSSITYRHTEYMYSIRR